MEKVAMNSRQTLDTLLEMVSYRFTMVYDGTEVY